MILVVKVCKRLNMPPVSEKTEYCSHQLLLFKSSSGSCAAFVAILDTIYYHFLCIFHASFLTDASSRLFSSIGKIRPFLKGSFHPKSEYYLELKKMFYAETSNII